MGPIFLFVHFSHFFLISPTSHHPITTLLRTLQFCQDLTWKNIFYLLKIFVNTRVNWKPSFICACFLVVNPCSTNRRSLLKHRYVKNILLTCKMTSRRQTSTSGSDYTHSNQLHHCSNWWEFSELWERINLCFRAIAHTYTKEYAGYDIIRESRASCDESQAAQDLRHDSWS